MSSSVILETDRLVLRRWKPADRVPFAQINSDPTVMEFMPAVLTRDESDRLADRVETHFRQHGFGPCAVESRRHKSFIGFIGLSVPEFRSRFTPCVEIGWRLAPEFWGQGLATLSWCWG